jgi:hypothetical protein
MKLPRLRFIVALCLAIGVLVGRLLPQKSKAQIAQEHIEALQRFRAIQDTMLNVYIEQLSRQTNER